MFDELQRGGAWTVVERLKQAGAFGLICPSYARDVAPGAANVVLWRFGPGTPCTLTVYDPRGDLPRHLDSWR